LRIYAAVFSADLPANPAAGAKTVVRRVRHGADGVIYPVLRVADAVRSVRDGVNCVSYWIDGVIYGVNPVNYGIDGVNDAICRIKDSSHRVRCAMDGVVNANWFVFKNLRLRDGGRFGLGAAGKPRFGGVHEGAIRAATVVDLGKGIDIKEFRVKIGLEGDHGVRHVLVERGDGGDDGGIGGIQRAILGEFGGVEGGGQRFGMLRGEVQGVQNRALSALGGMGESFALVGGEVEQEREIRADGGDGVADVGGRRWGKHCADVVLCHVRMTVATTARRGEWK